MFFVYILKCADGSFYTGHTDNIEKRLFEHQNHEIKCYTSKRLPIELVYVDTFGTRDEALESERQIKGWSRKKKEALIQEDWQELVRLSAIRKNTDLNLPTLRPFESLRANGEGL